MNYGDILTKAWKTIWKHKVIIWFGMLMAIPSALMGIVMGAIFYSVTEENLISFFEGNSQEPETFLFIFLIFFVSMILFTILSYAMMALSFTGALKGTFDLKEKGTTISFHELWDASLPFLWRIFGIMAIIFIGVFSFFAIIMFLGTIFGAVTAGIGFICLTPLILLIIPLELIAFLFAAIAMTAVVIEDIGVFDALRKAKDMLKEKFWPWILMGVIVGFIVWGVSMIAMIPMQIAQFAFMMPMMTEPYIQDPTAFLRPFAILMIVMMPLMGIVQGLSLSYANAVWVFSYIDLTTKTENDEEIIEYA